MTSKNYRAPLLHYIKLCASSQTPRWIRTAVAVRRSSIRVKIGDFFAPCDLEIQWMSLKNNREPLLCYIKLCASFQSHRWIQTKLQSGNAQFGSKSAIYCPVWPSNLMDDTWKTIGHLFYVASSFVYHFIAIGEFKLKLQCRNAQFGSKSAIYCPVWPSNLMDDLEKQQGTSTMLLLAYASFRSHWWIQTGVTVRKRPIWVKIDDFWSRVILKFDGWPWKTTRHLF